jgi:hypothetical protein
LTLHEPAAIGGAITKPDAAENGATNPSIAAENLEEPLLPGFFGVDSGIDLLKL